MGLSIITGHRHTTDQGANSVSRQIVTSQHRDNSGSGKRIAAVDPLNLRVRMGRAHKDCMGLTCDINVIGVVAAAKGYFGFMIFGLMLSVVLTGALATYMANYIQRHIWIAYVGLIFILIVGLQLVIGGLVDLEILKINEEFNSN